MKFSELGLNPKVLEAVAAAGYDEPTPIQAQAIPHALEGRDILGIAQTGTGKTASFSLPMLTHLAKGRARARMPRSLILAPTRELAAQVAENFETYGAKLNLSMALLIGGVSFAEQDRIIDRGVDVLIATPGRLIDHFERGKLMLTGIEIMVVDEADRMLDMGFIEDIERIFKLTPFTRQTLFFSATMPPEITRLTQEFLSNPVRVEVARASSTADTVEQRLCPVPGSRRDHVERSKRKALRALIDAEGDGLVNAIIFCNRKRDVSTLYKSLTKHGYNAGALHGDLDQRIRMQVLDGFKNGQLKLLVASDVAARGLDIPTVSHVFNFDVPVHSEDYVHRIGRTGRAGRSGVAITLSTNAEAKALAKVEELIKKEIPRVELDGVFGGEEEDERPPRRERGDRAERGERGERGEKSERGGRRRRGGRDREEERETPSAETAERREDGDDRRSNRRRGGKRREDRDPPVIGMGDHVPAFLLREVVLPSRRKSKDSEDDADLSIDDSEAPDAEDDTPVETVALTALEETDAPQEKPRSRRRRRKSTAEAAETVDAANEGESETEATTSADLESSAA